MADGLSQTLLLFSTLDIALISIAIAVYAISATYLGRETRSAKNRMEKRKELLDVVLTNLAKKGQSIASVKREIKQAEKDIARLNRKLFFLSWTGAVLTPSTFFIASLAVCVLGFNADFLVMIEQVNTVEIQAVWFSSVVSSIGFALLLVVIKTIDSVVKHVPSPDLKIIFDNKVDTLSLTGGIEHTIHVRICNKGEEIAENMNIFFHFPPEFNVTKSQSGYSIAKQADNWADYPDYTSAVFEHVNIHVEEGMGFYISVITPPENRTFEIPVYCHEQKIGLIKKKIYLSISK
jgi:hypothetical protein